MKTIFWFLGDFGRVINVKEVIESLVDGLQESGLMKSHPNISKLCYWKTRTLDFRDKYKVLTSDIFSKHLLIWKI